MGHLKETDYEIEVKPTFNFNNDSMIYLVEVNNLEPYEDNDSWIENAFTSFRNASQWLVDEGFEPYYEVMFGEGDIRFYWQENEGDEYLYKCEKARIIEMKVMS